MKILFLHGMEGRPNGTKAEFLKSLGYEVFAPSLPKEDMFESIRIAQEWLDRFEPDVIVGSSRGGAITAHLNTAVRKIMIAPAYRAFALEPCAINEEDTILHCADDDIVPYRFSVDLEQSTECRLIECGENHRMSDNNALETLKEVVKNGNSI